ncbi:MAG TPA: heparinase II/III family protein [Niabella sp.]|nr:heparinase II/III family protein [Niabella sp.]HOZ95802.1 heparinase II/III family protein [Niabella sp.]HQW13656.1 heparinase II/III family protein [Niabella sp.]HQX19050.1 heparinase II/III family protein [Niabella sp.]HQX42011.1 heparinase II/III family protein [Niabella sp.]
MHSAIIESCNEILTMPLLERELIGKRLLNVSREALRRIFYLSYAYRMTKDQRYAKRAETEMLQVSTFSDWNPSHFLDVAEMTLGVAIGYDWLYDQLSKDASLKIRSAIINKGIEPSFSNSGTWWIKGTNNWSQVCHAGMAFGAIAVYEDYKEKADFVLQRAVDNLPIIMNMYNPDGAYPEGYGYWAYGSTFNVLFIDAWEKFRKSKYSYTGLEGFLKTPYYLLHMVGPSNQNFNYSDGGSGLGIQPAMYWFAKNINDASIIWNDTKFIEKNATSKLNDERLLPALLVWAKDIHLQNTNPQSGLYWVGGGVNPVAMMRSSWIDPNALYLGFKTGTPSASHGHMDVGSFVLDADGLRWASDFGMQNYNSLESNGVDLWNMSQNSPRWSVFRYNNLAHNTLSFNNQHQVVKGKAEIGSYSTQPEFMNAIADISEVYAGQIQVAKRGVALIDGKYALVRDELKTLPKPTTVRWTLLTTAAVIISDTNTIVLTQGGKKMYLKIKSNNTFAIKSWSTTSPNSYDAPNPGTSLVGFESVLPADKTTQFDVFLIPEKNLADVNYTILSLAQWPKN